ncbi:hypothetical protein BU25DRAFT_204833 [Macroventuria anomochaeta]|uniref:Uncharacterized protein n=1 Tax=Macroventuria anomochaeta TaxID=301207 RepID=A0ACB6RMU1_9PLEO|nr:uncharacterized protein BU25DRAFT_204833 [Macroventuria anomochaeta]KAF2622720.1 hypothetical protein BU25DRAFT_204833 [Macroventuria anomochaeta]
MAPRTATLRPATEDRVSDSRSGKTKHKAGPIRRLENGLLDVTRKSGKHIRAIKINSETPLLRLLLELRNRIWEYALGGHVFNFMSHQIRKPKEVLYIARTQNLQKYPMTLLQVCCQYTPRQRSCRASLTHSGSKQNMLLGGLRGCAKYNKHSLRRFVSLQKVLLV